MKRFMRGIFTFALGSVLLSTPSFAAQGAGQNKSDSLKQKEMEKTSTPAEQKGFEHKSQYQREQQEGTAAPQAVPEKGLKAQKLSDKYDSSPVGFQE